MNQGFGNLQSICLEGMKHFVQTELRKKQKKQHQILSYELIWQMMVFRQWNRINAHK